MPVFRPVFRRPCAGFTLIELMVAVALLAVVMSLAAPSFRSLLEAQRMRAAAFDLMADLTLARSEALKRGELASPVTLSRSASNASGRWDAGWSIKVGSESVSSRGPAGSGVTITGPDSVVFDRNGRVAGASSVARFALASSTASQSRCISLDPSGRPKSSTTACPSS